MQHIHHWVRTLFPFLYKRNWYNGQFEFVPQRAVLFLCIVAALTLIVGFALWMGKPIEYAQPR